MQRYNLRTTSLNNNQLNTELSNRGAKTFGTLERKQQRLQRFIDAETNQANATKTLRVVIENEQRKVYTRSQARAQEVLAQKPRIARALNDYLGW